jgi:alpha-2-macroglobulin
VRPAVPLTTEVHGGSFTKDSVTVPVDNDMLPEYRKLETVVSPTPIGLAQGLAIYLKNYPNGCSEQITSGAFSRLVLADNGDFQLPRAEIFKQLEYTFAVERRRQNDQGAFGLWTPGQTPDIDFVSAYVMDFLIEAKASGFMPPADEFQNGLRFLQKMAAAPPQDLEQARIVAYAIYLVTREQVITTNYILNLEDYLDKNFPKKWQDDLTGVYLAGALSMLKKDAEAQKLIDAYHMGDPDRRGGWCDFYDALGADSQYVEIVSRHFPGVLQRTTPKDFEAITRPIDEGDFDTLTAAYAIIALKSYSEHMAQNQPPLSITEIGKDKRETQISADGKLLKRADFSPKAASLRFATASPIGGMGAFYQVIETGYDRKLPVKAEADGLEVTREFLDENGKVTHTAVLGQPLKERLSIRSINGSPVTNVAIDDLLPGGFEVVGSSLKPGAGSAGCDYVDVREDRAVFFTSVGMSTMTIEYQIKPCNRGQFVVPPIYAESMYNRAIKARGVADHIEVVDPKPNPQLAAK